MAQAGKYVQVLYDLDYKNHEGEPISIREGDKCLLLKKSNDDWWSVIKQGEKKAVYVPSNYVEEIVPATSPKPALHKKPPEVPKKPGKPVIKEEDVTNADEEKAAAGEDGIPPVNHVTLGKPDDKKSPTEENSEDEDDTVEYVNVQEYKKQIGLKPRSPNPSIDRERSKSPALLPKVSKSPQRHSSYEPAEYANIAAIQEAIHSKTKV